MPYAIPVVEKIDMATPKDPREFVGTHRAVVKGDKAYLQSLELIDEMDDGPMGKIGRKDLEAFCEATNQKISEGQYPQMVVRHPRSLVPGDIPRDDSVGRVCSPLSVRMSPETGRWTVYADVEYGIDNFRDLVLSNKYPRRSVEITEDTHSISQVAMLGRNRPAAGVRDVYFDSTKSRSIESRSETSFQERHMTKIDNAKAMFDALDDTEKAEFMKLCSGDTNPEDGKKDENDKGGKPFEDTKDDEDKKKESDVEKNFEAQARKLGEQAATIERLQAQQAASASRLVELEVRPKLQAMFEHGGYQLDVEKELSRIMALPDAKQRDEYFEHIRTHYRQRPTVASLVGAGVLPAVAAARVAAGADAEFTVEDRDRVVDFCSVQKEPMTFEEGCKALGLERKLRGTSRS